MLEEWRPIPGFVNYEASNLGRIRLLSHYKVRRNKFSGYDVYPVKGRVRKPAPRRDSNGREDAMILSITINGQQRTVYVHQLVLFAFIGPRPEGFECCHHDGNFRNNELSNLRWDTSAANKADAKRHGTFRLPPRGIKNVDSQSAS